MSIIEKIQSLKDFKVQDEIYTGYKNLLHISYSDPRHPKYHSIIPVGIIYTSDKEYKIFRPDERLEALLMNNGYHPVEYIAVDHVFQNYNQENMYDPIYVGSLQNNDDWNPEYVYRGFSRGMIGDWKWEDDGWDTHGEWYFNEDTGEDEDRTMQIPLTDWHSEEYIKKYCDKNKKYRAIIDNYSGIYEFKNGEWIFQKDDEIILKKCVQTDMNSNIIRIKGKRTITILDGDEDV